jgi:hypothetical protein
MTEVPDAQSYAKSSSDASLNLRREDLAAITAAYLRDSRTPRQWGLVAAGIGGLALGPALMSLGGLLGWSSRLEPYFFFGGWAVIIGCGILIWRRERKVRRHYQFACPACQATLLDGIRDETALARVEVIIATGNCPRCGSSILAP